MSKITFEHQNNRYISEGLIVRLQSRNRVSDVLLLSTNVGSRAYDHRKGLARPTENDRLRDAADFSAF